ncbi:SufE family protein [Pseudomonas paeninsulae]|uniref:SufE family protein n=1 Tax=Pseudomonas paeninsulae TaxID=3110772 RepID=UPI002D789363|nr:SufE family protein [Pseudomonas sp. IT1137]
MSQFGTQISSDDIIETLSFFDDWEERYKYIIDLGRELPPLDDAQRTDEHLVRGCQSQVWLVSQQRDDRLFFDADSDAFIVKGLLAVVLAAYNGKRPAEIRDFDIEQYFEQLNLIKHLSVTRGNGLRAMVQRIQATAAAAL